MTLLRKAAFDGIHDGGHRGLRARGGSRQSPLDADILQRHHASTTSPPPQWGPAAARPSRRPRRCGYRPVAPELLARLRAGSGGRDGAEATRCARSAELLQAPGKPDLQAVLGFALEVREYLLVEQRNGPPRRARPRSFAHSLAESRRRRRPPSWSTWLDTRTLRALIVRAPPRRGPRSHARLAGAPRRGTRGQTLERLIDLLAEEGDGPRAPAAPRARWSAAASHAPQAIAARLHGARRTPAASLLLRVLAEVDPPAALHAAGRRRDRRRTRRCSARRCGTSRRRRLQPRRSPAGCTDIVAVAPRGRAARRPAGHGRARGPPRLPGPAGPRREAARPRLPAAEADGGGAAPWSGPPLSAALETVRGLARARRPAGCWGKPGEDAGGAAPSSASPSPGCAASPVPEAEALLVRLAEHGEAALRPSRPGGALAARGARRRLRVDETPLTPRS